MKRVMNNREKIDLVEEKLKQAYVADDFVPAIAESWRHDVMVAVRSENSANTIGIEQTTIRLLHLSWIAAGIAACYILVFSLFYDSNTGGIENDLQNFYVDGSVVEFIPGESQ
jgi:hypothetical protein